MTDSYLPIAAQINSRAVSRDDVLAWEGPRAAKVARRLGIRGDHNRVELTRRIMNRKLELGYDALEAMLRRDARISDTGSRLGAALSRGRRNVATTVLTCDTGTAETIPDWYRTAFVADDDRPMLAASPDHWIFRHRADGRDEVVETAAASPVVVQMFFDEHNLRTVRSQPNPAFPVEWAAIALSSKGAPIGGIRHRFRDETPCGFTVELNVEFPITVLPPMITWHCWHLASEFSNWLEFANGTRDPSAM